MWFEKDRNIKSHFKLKLWVTINIFGQRSMTFALHFDPYYLLKIRAYQFQSFLPNFMTIGYSKQWLKVMAQKSYLWPNFNDILPLTLGKFF